MERIVLKGTGTHEDMWNAVVDALHGDDVYDNEAVQYVLVAMDYYNEMEHSLHEGYVDKMQYRVKDIGFDSLVGELKGALDYVDAPDYKRIVDRHLANLFNLQFRYHEALENGTEIEENKTAFINAVREADEDYTNLNGELKEDIKKTIIEKKDYIFE